MLCLREEPPDDATQDSVKLRDSLCGERLCEQSFLSVVHILRTRSIYTALVALMMFHSFCVLAKRSMLLNMTSGSLEAFGGEASRAEL